LKLEISQEISQEISCSSVSPLNIEQSSQSNATTSEMVVVGLVARTPKAASVATVFRNERRDSRKFDHGFHTHDDVMAIISSTVVVKLPNMMRLHSKQ
jgi:hypothetical protein